MVSDVKRFANGGVMPEHTRWLWRATGVLLQDPEAAKAMLEAFQDKSLNDSARELILDCLASAGNASSQAALRGALDSPVTRKSAEAPMWIQRVSFVDAPERATAEQIARVHRD